MGQTGIKHAQSQALAPLLPNLQEGFPFRGSRNVTHLAATRRIRCVIPYGIQTGAANAMHTYPEPFQVPFSLPLPRMMLQTGVSASCLAGSGLGKTQR